MLEITRTQISYLAFTENAAILCRLKRTIVIDNLSTFDFLAKLILLRAQPIVDDK